MCAMCPNNGATNMTKHQSEMYLKDLIIIDANGNVSEGMLESNSDSSEMERTEVVESLQTVQTAEPVQTTEPTTNTTTTPQPQPQQKQGKPKGRPAKRK